MADVDTRMTATNLASALLRVYNVVSQGPVITLAKAGTKDKFGEIMDEVTLPLSSFPIRFTPFTRDVQNKISWAEKVDVIFYCSKKQINDLSLTVEQLKQYTIVRHENKDYVIEHLDRYSYFANDCLYIVIGGKIGS